MVQSVCLLLLDFPWHSRWTAVISTRLSSFALGTVDRVGHSSKIVKNATPGPDHAPCIFQFLSFRSLARFAFVTSGIIVCMLLTEFLCIPPCLVFHVTSAEGTGCFLEGGSRWFAELFVALQVFVNKVPALGRCRCAMRGWASPPMPVETLPPMPVAVRPDASPAH